MSNEQINRKLAEFMGWKRVERLTWRDGRLDPPHQFMDGCGHIPDYTKSLDAVAEVEARLTPEQAVDYIRNLSRIVNSEHCFEVENRFTQITAKAPQRAEALCRTLSLWEAREIIDKHEKK